LGINNNNDDAATGTGGADEALLLVEAVCLGAGSRLVKLIT
jgi:hypothetical protein